MMEESQAVEQLLCCKQSIMSEGKQSKLGKQAASLRHLANGLPAANISGVEPCRAPAARWEKAAVSDSYKRRKSPAGLP